MRDVLTDIVRQAAGLFDELKITGSDTETKIQAVNPEKTLYLQAFLKQPAAEFSGVFGIGDLSVLEGLLKFAPYKSAEATFNVGRKLRPGEAGETVMHFTFKDAHGAGSVFRTKAAGVTAEQATIGTLPWAVSVVPTKSKLDEFTQLANLYSEVSKNFATMTRDGALLFTIGDEGSSTHNAAMVIEAHVEGEIASNQMLYSTTQFLAVNKQTGTRPKTIRLSPKGVIGIAVETEFAEVTYYLRAKR